MDTDGLSMGRMRSKEILTQGDYLVLLFVVIKPDIVGYLILVASPIPFAIYTTAPLKQTIFHEQELL